MKRWIPEKVVANIALITTLLCATPMLQAAVTLYGINNNPAAIQTVNSTNSVATTVYTGTPFPLSTQSAALAQCPSGLLYFVSGGTNGTLYKFNPATPNVAPVAIGSVGASVPSIIRLACRASTGVVYGMGTSPSTLYTFSLTSGAASATTLTLPGTTPPASGSGDIAFDSAGTLYFVGERTASDASTVRLWTINLGTNTVANVGAITGLPAVANGIAFDSSGNLWLSLTGETRLYAAPVSGGASSAIGTSGAMPALTDLSTKDVPSPDLSITKTDTRSFISAGGAQTYTVVVTNNSSYAVTGTVTDTVPANVTGVTWTCSATSGSSCAAASGSGNTINTSATLAASGSATYTVSGTLSASAIGTLSNTANVSVPAWLTDATPANNSATDTTEIRQNPTIAKAFSPSTAARNGISTLTFTLTNNNATALTGIAFTDTYPTSLVNATPLTVSGTCTGVTTSAVAGGNSFNVTGGSIPGGAPGSCTISVQVTSNTAGTYANSTSGVTAAQTTTAGPVSNNATLTVNSVLTLAKSAQTYSDPVNGTTNPKAIPGAFVDYTITVNNPGISTVSADSLIVTDAVPPDTDLFVGNLGGVGSGPVAFTNGSPSSGLTYTFTSLASTADDVSFSRTTDCNAFTYTPTPSANGVDNQVCQIRINPKAAFNANSSFQLKFRVRLE